jgi:hypothetical protein
MRKVTFWELLHVFLIVLLAYGYFVGLPRGNGNSRLGLVKSFVEKGRLDIDEYHATSLPTPDESYFEKHYYSDKAIGASLLGIEFYFPVYRFCRLLGCEISIRLFTELSTFLVISLLCALMAPLVYSFASRLSGSASFALLITAIICLGTTIYPFSTRYYSHALVAMFLFVIFYIWFDIKNQEKINLFKVLLSGFLFGYTFITEYPAALIMVCLGGYILYVLFKKKALLNIKVYALLIISALLPVCATLLYNHAVFHNPLSTGYAYEANPEFSGPQSQGLMGIGLPNLAVLFYMTFHATIGVFWQNPVLVVAFAGWAVLLFKNSDYRAEAILSFAIILIYFVVMSGYFHWWGGNSPSVRGIIPAIPFFAIPLIFTPKKLRGLLLILALISIFQMFIVVAASENGLTLIASNSVMEHLSVGTMFQKTMIYSVFVPNFLTKNLAVNRGQEFFNLTGFKSLVPFFVAEIGLLLFFFAYLRNRTKKSISDG